MSSNIIALVILAGSCGGLLLTMRLRHRLPPHHQEDATRDLIKIATGMMATLVALILGLLVSSAKTTFDTATAEVTQSGAQIIALDRTLRNYGPEAQPLRELLRSNLAGSIARVWPGRVGHGGSVNRDDSSVLDEFGEAIRKVSPQNQVQTHLQARAIDQAGELSRARWLLFEQMQNPLPQVFLIVLGFWLIQLFVGLVVTARYEGLPGNPQVVVKFK